MDGCFSDDVGGLGDEHGQAVARMGYTHAQAQAVGVATRLTWQRAAEKLARSGGYNYQMFRNQQPPTTVNCVAKMRQLCAMGQEQPAMMMTIESSPFTGPWICSDQTMASFLIARPVTTLINFAWLYYNTVAI